MAMRSGVEGDSEFCHIRRQLVIQCMKYYNSVTHQLVSFVPHSLTYQNRILNLRLSQQLKNISHIK